MAGSLPTPQPSRRGPKGSSTARTDYTHLQSLEQSSRTSEAEIAALQERTDSTTLVISYPANQAYPIEIAAPFGYTINKTQSKCTSGTCTLTFTIGETALGGGANSVSSTLEAKTHTSANVVAVGDTLTATVSANSCVGLICVIEYVRT